MEIVLLWLDDLDDLLFAALLKWESLGRGILLLATRIRYLRRPAATGSDLDLLRRRMGLSLVARHTARSAGCPRRAIGLNLAYPPPSLAA